MKGLVPPGATLGVLGGGQLGRMLALSARHAGYRISVLTDAADSPAAQVADAVVVADYADADAVAAFAAGVDALTFEFENVASAAVEAAERVTMVRPGPRALHVAQDRGREKEFVSSHGFPHARFVVVTDPSELAELAAGLYPFVAKTAGFGYDGKGQAVVQGPADLAAVAALLRSGPVVLEEYVELAAEVSVVGARSATGRFALYRPFVNRHVAGVLDVTLFPWPHAESPGALAGLPWGRLAQEAQEAAAELFELLELVGVACIEFFVTPSGRLLVNEIAPRPHNSGHLTIEACATSQFEQQWRAVCGLPLGSTAALSPAAMANLLGDLWARGEPRWDRALDHPGTTLHLYGKRQARPGRKMGHLTALGPSGESAAQVALSARASLTAGEGPGARG